MVLLVIIVIRAILEAILITTIRTPTVITVIIIITGTAPTLHATRAAITIQIAQVAMDRLEAGASAVAIEVAAVAAVDVEVADNNLNINLHEKDIFLSGFHCNTFYG